MTATQPAPAITQNRILDAAMELFYFQGYEATSIGDIVRRANVRSGSLYYFYENKEALLVAVLGRYMETIRAEVLEPAFRLSPDPLERVFSLLDHYRQALIFTRCTGGCPLGNLAAEVSRGYPQARAVLEENFAAWRRWVRASLEDARGRFPAETDLDQLAVLVMSVMEGGVMQARVQGSAAPFEASVRGLRDYIGRLAGAEGKHG